MQTSPNRDRAMRSGCHCAQCSPWILRSAGDDRRCDYQPVGKRIGNVARHGKAKPKGQHAYRRGLVR